MSQVAHQADTYLQFLQHEVTIVRVILLHPGWDSRPSQG